MRWQYKNSSVPCLDLSIERPKLRPDLCFTTFLQRNGLKLYVNHNEINTGIQIPVSSLCVNIVSLSFNITGNHSHFQNVALIHHQT